MRTLIIGCGYLGITLGRLLAQRGHTVTGLRRGTDADAEISHAGMTPFHADISVPGGLASLDPAFDIVINLVSSSKGGVEEYQNAYLAGTRNILRWLASSPPRKYIYTSSTSVYGQTDGEWVDEESPTEPESATSRVLVEAERLLLEAHRQSGFPAVVVRASGIYGPGRGHLFKQFVAGEATMRDDGSNWINMIHVHDLATAIAHLIEHGTAGEVYNASDDAPVSQREFFEWLASQLHRPMPPQAPPAPNRKRGLTNKRVTNTKLKETGFQFAFPTFREGYAADIERLVRCGHSTPPYIQDDAT